MHPARRRIMRFWKCSTQIQKEIFWFRLNMMKTASTMNIMYISRQSWKMVYMRFPMQVSFTGLQSMSMKAKSTSVQMQSWSRTLWLTKMYWIRTEAWMAMAQISGSGYQSAMRTIYMQVDLMGLITPSVACISTVQRNIAAYLDRLGKKA